MLLVRKIKLLSSWTGLGFGFCCLSALFLSIAVVQLHIEFHQLNEICLRVGVSGSVLSPSEKSQKTLFRSEYDDDDAVIIYNRVPKTSSTSFVGVAYDLCVKNHFHAIHLNISKNNHVLSLSDQIRFVNNVSNWNEKKPAFYHGHIAYLSFMRFGVSTKPIYINIVREPLDRLISYYYFLRHGDDFRPHKRRRKAGNQETFDDCVERDGDDCSTDQMWLQIPFFCGHSAECWTVGSEWALEMAKHNLVNNYLVVGVTEELQDFIAVLEATLPSYFRGAVQQFTSGNRSHLRKTFNRLEPSMETVRKIQKSNVWKMENEFYMFAKEQFRYIKQKTVNNRGTGPRRKQINFMFEKIRPR